jgi:pterin-4a-carbinolamine dehydratase
MADAHQTHAPPTTWRTEGEALVREWIFRDFDAALRFIEQVAAEAVDHFRRPDMCLLRFNHVRLAIANPHRAGITLAEERLASKVDAVVEAHHPDAIFVS